MRSYVVELPSGHVVRLAGRSIAQVKHAARQMARLPAWILATYQREDIN